MKLRHRESCKRNAVETLKMLNMNVSQDFYTLSNEQVEGLVTEAKRIKYQRPKNANGSLARYFHAKLLREAGSK